MNTFQHTRPGYYVLDRLIALWIYKILEMPLIKCIHFGSVVYKIRDLVLKEFISRVRSF